MARELKSVHLDSPACALRLAVHRCHANALNPSNQVRLAPTLSLVESASIRGSPLSPQNKLHVPVPAAACPQREECDVMSRDLAQEIMRATSV